MKTFLLIIILIIILIFLQSMADKTYTEQTDPNASTAQDKKSYNEADYATAIMAGGCFWCVESDFEKIPDVVDVISGYSGGTTDNPRYEDAHNFGHKEVVKIVYNSEKTGYADLVYHLLRHIDPTDDGGSFYDRGGQYTSTIYYANDEEKTIAETIIAEIDNSGRFDKPIVTSVEARQPFYIAEEFHQDYAEKNKDRYQAYRNGSGRDPFLEDHWTSTELKEFTKPQEKATEDSLAEPVVEAEEKDLKESLSDLSYNVTQYAATEAPFSSPLNDEKRDGIYVDIVSGKPLFSSKDKYDSGSGWPAFYRPIEESFVEESIDMKIGVPRTEVKSADGSHLGHVFNDGPAEEGGQRFCINGAALRFVPKEELEKEGYGEYAGLFA